MRLEEREGGACVTRLVGEMEVVAAGIVEVDGGLDQPQAKHAGVELGGLLCIGGDERNVMQAEQRWGRHEGFSCPSGGRHISQY